MNKHIRCYTSILQKTIGPVNELRQSTRIEKQPEKANLTL